MSVSDEIEELVARLPRLQEFGDVANAAAYHPVPVDWLLAVADVVDSTGAIAAGDYKSVNMVGASVIAAARNALGAKRMPFVFGGDGAVFAVPASGRGLAQRALASVAVWSSEAIGLTLRTALVPTEDIRAAGHDVRLALFDVSPSLSYAMFAGGGVAWAEAQMKSGHYRIEAAPAGSRPDLDGLSCRWQPIRPLRGTIASLLVLRQPGADLDNYRTLVRDIVAFIDQREIAEGRPVSFKTAKFALSPRAIDLELRTSNRGGSYFWRWIKMAAFHVMVRWIFRFGIRVGGFDPNRYRRETVRNTDFRKFEDGLKLTIDCSPATFDGLSAMLARAEQDGTAHFGIHQQRSALMTCIVQTAQEADHIHFVDGAEGGYAKAAELMKAKASDPASMQV